MKQLILTLLVSISIFSCSFAALPGIISEQQRKTAILNLMIGITSENNGLKLSSAYLLGELKAEEAVIELMRILHSDREEERITAALALYKIGSSKGIFAVKQLARFDDSERVKKLCASFYHCYLKSKIEVDSLLTLK